MIENALKYSKDKKLFIKIENKKIIFENKIEKDYTEEEISKWQKSFYNRFFGQQYKRSCMPDGPKVGSISLSPRGDFRMPSDATGNLWR